MNINTMHIDFNGLYFWGSGWKDELTRVKWIDFWDNNLKSSFWSFFHRNENEDYLVGVCGSIYLHPMSIDVVKRNYGSTKVMREGKWIEYDIELEDLKDACKKCAEFCGGSVSFSEIKTHELKL